MWCMSVCGVKECVNRVKKNCITYESIIETIAVTLSLQISSTCFASKFAKIKNFQYILMTNRIQKRLPPGIPTGRNPHWTESPPEFHVSVGIQDSGDSNTHKYCKI